MKKTILMGLMALTMSATTQARNKVTTVENVTESVTVDTDIDYQITGETPFGEMGSVNITNTEHGVLIIRKVKPSQVIANLMGHIYINGEQAVDGTNCQVKMYDRGAIVMPYDKSFKPLTCYTEENYGGDSYNNYTEGSAGGYMKTLNATTLNNKIKSFKLKRGYMVTFAVGTGGWGYSRCFIADQEDLEIPVVPAPMNGKISSYRLFKWWNAHKAGGASSGSSAFNQAINASWCYDWAQGNASLLPDVEWVPNHIYEDYPSSATCGGVTGSCHMKTNNEPANSSDDHPQSVETVLNNWQNLMRTGMRLCSPATHDGGWSWHNEFMKEIDARGWRCDLVDFHGYWDGEWGNLGWRIDTYAFGRPVWFSEWLWGASWNGNGIFKAVSNTDDYSTANQQTMYNGTKPILDKLNSNTRVERYAIWNGERNASKIYKDGSLSTLGKYYATMDDGLGYNANNQFVPTIVYQPINNFTSTFTTKTKTIELTWEDPNGDMIDSMVVECKWPNTSKWVTDGVVYPIDMSSKNGSEYKFSKILTEAGMYTYRVVTYLNGAKKFTSDEATCTVSAANAIGTLQYGQLKIGDDQPVTTEIEEQEVTPYVVTGLISNKNSKNGITSQMQTLTKKSFKFCFKPWTLTTPVTFDKAESIDYMVLPADTVLHLADDFMLISQLAGSIKGDEVEVTFPEAFPEGVTPVVVAQQYSSLNQAPVTVKVYDVTNKSFKTKLVRQEGVTTSFNGQKVNYFAATPGQISVGGGKMLTVGRNEKTPVGGGTRQSVAILDANGDTLHLVNPTIIAAPQTNNYGKASVFRLNSTTTDADGAVYVLNILRQVDGTNTTETATNLASKNGDYVGWMIISDDPNGSIDDDPTITPTAISSISGEAFGVSVSNGIITAKGKGVSIYNAAGQQMAVGQKVPAGIYVVKQGKESRKIVVK